VPPDRDEVVDRCRGLRVRALDGGNRLGDDEPDADALAAAWCAEALGTLLWALGLLEVPNYDRSFGRAVFDVEPESGELRHPTDLERARETAALWHWRARTAELEADGALEPTAPYASIAQLVAATAMRGFENGLLPEPYRGDLPAFGASYGRLDAEQLADALSIALERHRALAWLTSGEAWDEVTLDT
jgi:hypothetical protein